MSKSKIAGEVIGMPETPKVKSWGDIGGDAKNIGSNIASTAGDVYNKFKTDYLPGIKEWADKPALGNQMGIKNWHAAAGIGGAALLAWLLKNKDRDEDERPLRMYPMMGY